MARSAAGSRGRCSSCSRSSSPAWSRSTGSSRSSGRTSGPLLRSRTSRSWSAGCVRCWEPNSSRAAGPVTGWRPGRAWSWTWTWRPGSASRPRASWPPPPQWPWPRPNARTSCCPRAPRSATSRTRTGRIRPATRYASCCAGSGWRRLRRRLRPGTPAGGRLRGSGRRRGPARRGSAPLVHVGRGRSRRASQGIGRLRGAAAAARPRARRRPGAADTGAAPGHPARAGRRAGPERLRPGGASRPEAGRDPAGRARPGEQGTAGGVGRGRRRPAGAGHDHWRGRDREDDASRDIGGRGRRGWRHCAADPLLRDRTVAVPAADRRGDRAGGGQYARGHAAPAAR